MKTQKRKWFACLCLLFVIGMTAVGRDLAVQARVYTVPCVLIDPGHGGFDPGAIGSETKVEEKQINLAISKLLKAELEQRGYRVMMTREEDIELADSKRADLEQRRKMIQNSGADLVLSIHQNSNPDRTAYAPMVLYYAQSSEGQRIAEIVLEKLNQAVKPARPRKTTADSSMFILKSGEMPILIVECGFLSYSKEEKMLQEKAGQQAIAKAIAEAVCQALPITGGAAKP